MKAFISCYTRKFPPALIYMLQTTEYKAGPYLRWFWRVKDFGSVMHRRTLEPTKPARMLLWALRLGIFAQLVVASWLLIQGIFEGGSNGWELIVAGVIVLFSYPVIWAHLMVVPLVLGRIFIAGPEERKLIQASRAIFAEHPGTTIAVAGSYGKTSMKELLLTVLSEGKKVAATPANKNVAISHAYFARKLTGDEEVLIIEYGEGKPGDVRRFAETTQPDMAVITGLAPAHLDEYKSLDEAARDIFAVADYLHDKNIFVNGDGEAIQTYIKPEYTRYTIEGVGDWNVSDISVNFDGTTFKLKKDKTTLNLHSKILGRHQVGPLAVVAAIAHELGLSNEQIEMGIAKTMPYEHRMQPRQIGSAWVLDDTYNGTIEGMKAGLKLLSELEGHRKIYVTPGLVDQGKETRTVHVELGRAIAAASPNVVVLMENSVTSFIRSGMEEGGYTGDIRIEDDPLGFYTSLEQFVAAGDVVLMQNDWTDNYA